MNIIGFNNFRRFLNFSPISYGGITFLVGRNNSGKSTVVKAVLLIIDYLKTHDISVFSFNQYNVDEANVTTYGRARSKYSSDNFISFYFSKDSFIFNITVTGHNDSTSATVAEFRIEDSRAGLIFTLNPTQSSVRISNSSISISLTETEDHIVLNNLVEEEVVLVNKLKGIKRKASSEYISMNAELASVKKKIKTIRATIKREQTQGVFELQTHYKNLSLSEILEEAISEFSAEYDVQYHEIQKGKKPKANFEALKAFKDSKFTIERSANEILAFSKHEQNVYLGAALSKQSALFSIRDKTNALSQAIHEFKQLGIDNVRSTPAYKFILEWMKPEAFGLGSSFEIIMHAGEAYEMLIETNGVKIHLADKGTGSIQIMLLLVRLATIIYIKQKGENSYTVIIEEPELNLHPAFQSKLALLFHNVNLEFGIQFIIETHSEYLIRKTQVIVKEHEYGSKKENPFSVLYFDSDTKQWAMNYRDDGKFIEEFGSGFFDETRNLVKKIL